MLYYYENMRMKYILIVVILTIPVFVFLSDKRLPDRGIGTSEGYFQKKTSITVLGDENCKEKTQEALDLLREKSAGDYAAVMDTMGAIRCIQSGSLVFPWQSPPTFEVGEETLNSGSLWYASVLSHETCHIQQFFRKEQWQGAHAEEYCLHKQYDVLVSLGADQEILDYTKNIISSKWWEKSRAEMNY
ncbi:hypothetical protein A3C91_00735 [Candidatus Azambacteria bacterium RIFCSPHIGHO2_02_FULL_52_12]|uniref:Uncharacterized protein n=1 Tax=Candidatus Azambacteria bacterium RIFCSPLOWO2_01_FULL_46_25 TaxID=1797298 RepID=A0A1F5BW20_9BACT|nr:MAG: hypothetical protein A3C91_00735 [Candidatus Azambacteria bacterium RIFCSPHIGHO2_02_FULL_52_12]OGD34814.1 MAG: hypothetical protein A2988_04975 [Candidatus Azambacteria bacterium RIFCSPLOWO2_01_FULL_46_25]